MSARSYHEKVDEGGRGIAIRPLGEADEEACARMMAESDPWRRLGRDFARCLVAVRDTSRERWVAEADGAPAGLLLLDMTGALVGCIRTICVAAQRRNRGIGSALLEFAEARIFAVSPNAFLSVSSFNEGARRLYERHGYEVVGPLRDYIVRGWDEILMRKTLGPIDEWRRRGDAGRPSG